MEAIKDLELPLPENEGGLVHNPEERTQYSGYGHQLKKDQKAFEEARQLFRDGMLALTGIAGPDALDIRIEAAKLMDRCQQLSYSANEKFEQND